jgi:adenosylhomocysteinase
MPNFELVERGRESFEWAKRNMPALRLATQHVLRKRGKSFKGMTLAASLHVSKETAVLLTYLKSLGLDILLAAANPLSSQDEIVAFLKSEEIDVRARRGESVKEYNRSIDELVRSSPDLIVDDGGQLHVAYARSEVSGCIGGTDETTSGTARLIALEREHLLKYPVITVNEARTKYLFDNRYGTGQSSLDGLIRATDLLIAGKTVVVVGYGWVGKGVALRARGLGANVIVAEIDPMKAVEAYLDGYRIMPMSDASAVGDIFLTCTGQTDAISKRHFSKMKNGAILGNCGHFDREINVSQLKIVASSKVRVKENVEKFTVHGRPIYLLCEGRVINLVAASGHPPEIMQLSFANQLLCLDYLVSNRNKVAKLTVRVLKVPEEIDAMVAKFALRSFHLNIDRLSLKQKRYEQSFSR